MEHLCYNDSQFKLRTLLDITLPGSHDAATYTMNDSVTARFAVTQTKTLKEQFELGVRYFDIRVHRTKAAKKGKEEELVFFHNFVKSAKEDVFPNMMDFLAAIVASNEVVIFKLHFQSPKDFTLFQDLYLTPELRAMIASPDDFKTQSIGKLISDNKRIVLMTNKGGADTDINCDYKSNSFGGWAETRSPEKLTTKMNQVRATLDESASNKLRIVQTNQPALVGAGGSRFASVLEQDQKPESRMVVHKFLDESRTFLTQAIASKNLLQAEKVRQATRGVISMDNIGSDGNKNSIVNKIIELNLDDQTLLMSTEGLESSGIEMKSFS